MDGHSQTRRLTDPQIALPGVPLVTPRRERIALDFTLDDIRRLKNESHAIMFGVRCSGYVPKEIPDLFGIDAGQWSCIKDGKKYFPHDRRNEFMDFLGNESLLMYGCESRGYDFSTLRKHRSDVEIENDRLRAENAELRKKADHHVEFVQTLLGRAAR